MMEDDDNYETVADEAIARVIDRGSDWNVYLLDDGRFYALPEGTYPCQEHVQIDVSHYLDDDGNPDEDCPPECHNRDEIVEFCRSQELTELSKRANGEVQEVHQ